MKHLFIIMALMALLMLGACRLEPSALLGNEAGGEAEESIHSGDYYELCRQQKVSVGTVENATGCATPSNLVEIMRHFDSSGKDNAIRIEFDKMWDGTFPKLQRIQYHRSNYNNGMDKPRDLTCKIVESAATVRVYECKLELPQGVVSNGYLFASMELAHDTCAAKATYKAAYLYAMCDDPSKNYYGSDFEVYFNRERLPEMSAYVAPTP